jgi:hypothetical protein
LQIPLKEGIRGESRLKERVTLRIISLLRQKKTSKNVLAKTSGSQAFWFHKSLHSRWTHTACTPLLVQAETCNFELYKQPVFTLRKALGREFTPCTASSGPGLNCRVPRALPYTSKTDLSFSSHLQVHYKSSNLLGSVQGSLQIYKEFLASDSKSHQFVNVKRSQVPLWVMLIFEQLRGLLAKASNNITPLDLPFNYNSKPDLCFSFWVSRFLTKHNLQRSLLSTSYEFAGLVQRIVLLVVYWGTPHVYGKDQEQGSWEEPPHKAEAKHMTQISTTSLQIVPYKA